MSGIVRTLHSEYAGVYELAESLINGYYYWLQQNGVNAVWFNRVLSNWKIGPKSKLGENFGVGGPKGQDMMPNEISKNSRWLYLTNGWIQADPSDVIFKAINKV